MTKKKLEETKKMLEMLRSGKATTAQMNEDDCAAVYGISKAQVLKNMDAAIAKHEREIERAENPLTCITKKLYEIASKHMMEVAERGDFEPRYNDSEDFIEVPICGLEAALKEAYEAGRNSK